MFAQKIKALRDQKGINQIQMAGEMNVAQGTIANWETGYRVPSTETISKLADYFGVTVDCLLGHNDSTELVVLTRRISEVSDEDKAELIKQLNNTVDVYLSTKKA